MVHILLCEDNLVNLQINKRYIELFSKELQKSIEIHEYQTVDQAIYEYIDQIDIAILDIDLNGDSGMEFAKRLQEGKRTIPIIFITNYECYRADASLILAVGLLSKPVDPDKFRILFQRSLA
ncbi:MAG: response regulator, partial [Clostridium sp.]|nr:response regulator [Clostridium sp.]